MNHLLEIPCYRKAIFELIRSRGLKEPRHFFASVNYHSGGNYVNFTVWEFSNGKFDVYPLNKCLGLKNDGELVKQTEDIWREEGFNDMLCLIRDGAGGTDFEGSTLAFQHFNVALHLHVLQNLIVYDSDSLVFFGPTLGEALNSLGLSSQVNKQQVQLKFITFN